MINHIIFELIFCITPYANQRTKINTSKIFLVLLLGLPTALFSMRTLSRNYACMNTRDFNHLSSLASSPNFKTELGNIQKDSSDLKRMLVTLKHKNKELENEATLEDRYLLKGGIAYLSMSIAGGAGGLGMSKIAEQIVEHYPNDISNFVGLMGVFTGGACFIAGTFGTWICSAVNLYLGGSYLVSKMQARRSIPYKITKENIRYVQALIAHQQRVISEKN